MNQQIEITLKVTMTENTNNFSIKSSVLTVETEGAEPIEKVKLLEGQYFAILFKALQIDLEKTLERELHIMDALYIIGGMTIQFDKLRYKKNILHIKNNQISFV